MTPQLLIQNAINPAIEYLPHMDSLTAKIIMLAIAFQESGIAHRRQISGPARGYWQFEMYGGVHGVLTHPASKMHIRRILASLNYAPDSSAAQCYEAIEHNDILAAAFARLLMWTDQAPLPGNASDAWGLYTRVWRPGKPHPETWSVNYRKSVEAFR